MTTPKQGILERLAAVMSTPKQGILERLAAGPVIGDGGFVIGLEKRGYVKAGSFTPECVVDHPDAVKQFHREFLRSGADVMQAFTYYSQDDRLQYVEKSSGKKIGHYGENINMSACRIAKEVAGEGDALVAGGICETVAYRQGKDKAAVQQLFSKQVDCFVKSGVDFIVCEYFGKIQEMEWAIEVAKQAQKPVAATMCIGAGTDQTDVPVGQCAIRMAKAGADIVGVNCNFGPYSALETVKAMKVALDKEGLKPYLMIQPTIWHTPDLDSKMGYVHLPEYPFALEARIATRFEISKWARDCYEAGIHYIGGCCGFEPHHIRAISEELWQERGKKCLLTEQNGFVAEGLGNSALSADFYRKKLSEDYWKNLVPATGRPFSPAYAVLHK